MATETYEADGHEVKVMETDSSVYGYINGKAINWKDADLSAVPTEFQPTETFESVKRFMAYCVNFDVRVCGKCGVLFEAGTGGTYPFAGIQCAHCNDKGVYCPDGSEHSFEVLNPHQRHNARVATKRKCSNCGYRKDSPPTG